MRTTVDIPDELYAQMKAYAAREGITIKAVLLRAVDRALGKESPKSAVTAR
jgi:hypothetical protein